MTLLTIQERLGELRRRTSANGDEGVEQLATEAFEAIGELRSLKMAVAQAQVALQSVADELEELHNVAAGPGELDAEDLEQLHDTLVNVLAGLET